MQSRQKYIIIAILFITIILVSTIGTAFRNRVSFKQDILKFAFNKELTTDIEEIYNTKLYGFNKYINFYSLCEAAMGTKLFDDAEYGHIIKDNNGKLYFPYEDKDINKPVSNTVAFASLLKEQNTPFLYVQAPNKVVKGYTIFPVGGYNYANDVADKFLDELKENEVDVLDLRMEISQDNLDLDSLFYKTDHHWTTKTAFWAFTKVSKLLNTSYNFEINDYYMNLDNYKLTDYKKSFLGSLGRRVGKYVVGVDDYTFIEPNFKTDYTIYYPKVSDTEPSWQGGFNETIAIEQILNSNDILANKHAAYFEYDYGNLIIKNNKIKNGKKILLIKDSFALPFAAFLSTGVSEVHLIDLRQADAPIPDEYIKENKFDIVMILYNTEVFGDPMFNLVEN